MLRSATVVVAQRWNASPTSARVARRLHWRSMVRTAAEEARRRRATFCRIATTLSCRARRDAGDEKEDEEDEEDEVGGVEEEDELGEEVNDGSRWSPTSLVVQLVDSSPRGALVLALALVLVLSLALALIIEQVGPPVPLGLCVHRCVLRVVRFDAGIRR